MKARDFLIQQLKQGRDPSGLARGCAIGVIVGVFPVFGATTSLGILLSFIFKTNQAVVQIVNYALTPFHLLAIPLFLKAGTVLFGGESIVFDLAQAKNEFQISKADFFFHYGQFFLNAILSWCLVAVPAVIILYFIFLRIFSKLNKNS